ncbi:MAG: ATP-binding protein [Treponema sp.]|nr:ATP-binding protein [Treponema sp.]
MLVGREAELAKLEELYRGERFECVIVYGRRRVGKTRLISEFLKEKEGLYISAVESGAPENLEIFSQALLHFASGARTEAAFPDFRQALDYIFTMARERRFVLAIDEFPYLAGAYRPISSLLQNYIDREHEQSKLFLILCGSSLSFMENQVLGYQSPLYGRRTAQFLIRPLNYFDSIRFYQSFKNEDLAVIYGLTAGVPQYLLQFDEKKSLTRNIQDNFFDPAAYLFEEPTNLVKQECREPAQYNAVIRAVARGSTRLSEIASRTALSTGLCSNYISTLLSLGILKKETPLGMEGGKKTFYALADSMFRFWYRFVPDNMALIQQREKNLIWERVAPQLPAFMGPVFEEICKQWLWRENLAGRLPILFTSLGRWWGNDPVRKEEAEIDILAPSDNEELIIGECKWTNAKLGPETVRLLLERARLFPQPVKYFYFFSKSGFTKACEKDAAAYDNLRLLSFSGMFG